MESNFHDLPPLKRFRLMNQDMDSNLSKELSAPPGNTPDHSYLPAKKRRETLFVSPADYGFCLPAKKRVWAVRPFDLNLELNAPFDSDELGFQKTPRPVDINSNTFVEKSPDPERSANEIDSDDDGIVCAVCGSTDGDPTDPIVFCDGCNLMVHSTCYGYPLTNSIPEGDWFCVQCLLKSTDQPLSCCLCPNSGGALKRTTDGRWAHLVCSIYVPEVFFSNPERREGINCGKVMKRRWDKNCYVCETNKGCVVDCSEPKCELCFHVTCGLKEELTMEYREGKKAGGVVVAFCRAHSDLWKKQEQTGRFKIVARPRDE